MSWQIKSEGGATVVVLDSELGIQNAAEFHQAVLPLAGQGGPVRIDARAAKSVHTSIMQILYALSEAVPDFAVIDASEEFRAIEARVGFSLPGSEPVKTSVNPPKPA
jgi:anti-anti-sigma regulatory factor